MVDVEQIRQALSLTLQNTVFSHIGALQRGKVRDCYIKDSKRTIIVTDRLSVFDRVVTTVPFKGQILNGLSSFWLKQTESIWPNHLISSPDPVASIVAECEPFPVEMVVRGFLTGSSPTSIWTHYDEGVRNYCGHTLPDGMRKHARFKAPLITPTTKAEKGGHDEPISLQQVVTMGLASQQELDTLVEATLALFSFGQKLADERGLVLVDTKYEFGRTQDGRIVLIDEIHTPDSSRYWYAESYSQSLQDGSDPRSLDKEYVRRYLAGIGYRGEAELPVIPADVRIEAARRYIEIYEQMTGQPFVPDMRPPAERLAENLGSGD